MMEFDDANYMPYLDVLSEPTVNMTRIYLIVRELQSNRNGCLVLTMEKLCFFNAAIVSESIVESILLKYNKSIDTSFKNIDEGYSYKNRDSIRESIQGQLVKDYVIQLCNLDILKFNIDENYNLLSIENYIDINEYDPLILAWKENIKRLKFCVSKSEKELFSSLVEASYE
ncbi:hypothetical protein ACLINJ_003029 [Vibrio cholerae]